MNPSFRTLGFGLVVLLSAAACSGAAANEPSAGPSAAGAVATDAAAPSSTAASDNASQAPSGRKVSANDATSDQLVAALTAAGVPSASRWAREVMEYRPYATDDPTLQKLQDNLAKYNPDPATLAAILAALKP